MDILHVDPERGWGGGEVQVVSLIRELDRRGHRSRLAADPRGRLSRDAAAAGAMVVPLSIRNAVDVAAGLRLRRLVAGHDVVHFHTARAHALAPWCRGRGARLVVTRRMDYVPRGGPYARWLYNHSVDAVIAISEGVRAALLRAGVQGTRIRVVPSGIDLDLVEADSADRLAVRQEWGATPSDVVVLVLGALERRKGHAVLLDAAQRLEATALPIRYVFCGDGSERGALVEASRPLGGRVHFAGFRRDVAACLAAADVVALPSLHEGLGVAALEAMASGAGGGGVRGRGLAGSGAAG